MNEMNGDLLNIESGVIIHQINCIGATGGLAGALEQKWKTAFKSYCHACNSLTPQLGNVVLGIATHKDTSQENWKLIIAHVFGQYMPGANTDMKAVDMALGKLSRQLAREEFQGVPVYAPYKMGCGLGGGDWGQYSTLLTKHLPEIIIVRK